MRKKSMGKLAVVVLFGVYLAPAASYSADYVMGDVNRDGTVTSVDSLLASQYYVGQDVAWFPETRGDVNCDGRVNIVDALLMSEYYIGQITEFPCTRTEQEELEIEANRNAEKVYAYYMERFGWDGLDGNGERAILKFADTPENNAEFLYGSITIGAADGVRSLSWAYSFDMLAHELTHGIIWRTSDLPPSAVNESYADVMAAFAGAKDDVVDWQLGENVWTPEIEGDALRNIDEPNKGVNRDTLSSCTYNPELPDLCGQAGHMENYANVENSEHINQGILNRAAYLLVEGGTQDGITVAGIGVRKAEQIYFRTMTEYLDLRATFHDVRSQTILACNELVGAFGITASDCQSVSDAFAAVGIVPFPVEVPDGISGYIMDGDHPAADVAFVLVASRAIHDKLKGSWTSSEVGEYRTDENGFYYLSDEVIDAALQSVPDVPLLFTIIYRNPDPTDTSRVVEWRSQSVRIIYNDATVIPTFDIASPAPMEMDGSIDSLPVTFSWLPQNDIDRFYYRWEGCDEPNEWGVRSCLSTSKSKVQPTSSFTVTDEITADFSNYKMTFEEVTSWRLYLSAYQGSGYTNLVPAL